MMAIVAHVMLLASAILSQGPVFSAQVVEVPVLAAPVTGGTGAVGTNLVTPGLGTGVQSGLPTLSAPSLSPSLPAATVNSVRTESPVMSAPQALQALPTAKGMPTAVPAAAVPGAAPKAAPTVKKSLTELDQAVSKKGGAPADPAGQSARASTRFDGTRSFSDTIDAVLVPGAQTRGRSALKKAPGRAVRVTGQGTRFTIAEGAKATALIAGEDGSEAFQVWKDKEGYRVRRQGESKSFPIPEKGFFIYRTPGTRSEQPGYRIRDRGMKEERVQLALSVEGGKLVAQDIGSITMRDRYSIFILDAQPEGAFPIEKVVTPAGHAFGDGAIRYIDETIAIDWENDVALNRFYDKVKARIAYEGVQGDELASLRTIFNTVVRGVKYDNDAIEARIAELGGKQGVLLGTLMDLGDEDSCTGGVCRHMALLLGAVLERLILEGDPGLSGGKVFYVGGKGHAWAVYRDAKGGYHVLDAAQHREEIPLTPDAKYLGEGVNDKDHFSYLDAMPPELKRDFRAGLPGSWDRFKAALRETAAGISSSLYARFHNWIPGHRDKDIIRRRLAEFTEQGRSVRQAPSQRQNRVAVGTLETDGAPDRKPATFAEIPSLDPRYTTPESRRRTITILGSSRAADPIRKHMDLASRIAGDLVRRGYNILTGCGNAGIMGAAYDAAAAASKEAARAGTQAGENLAIVVTPAWGDENLTDARAIGIADSEAARIEKFHQTSDTFLVFPGGASSLQEAATLIAKNARRGDTPPKRILLVGKQFFAGLEAQYTRLYAEGRLASRPNELFQVVDSADEVVAALTAPQPAAKKAKPSKDPAAGYTRQVAGAYLVYPGGPAALQEAATLIARNKYRGKNPPIRIYLIGRDFFSSLSMQYQRLYEDGLLGSKPEELFSVVDSPEEVPAPASE